MATGETEGGMFLLSDEEVLQMPQVKVRVLDANGRVVQEVQPAVDSGACFREVPLGRYSVRAEPELVRRGRLLAGGGPAVTLVPVQRCAMCAEIVSGGTGAPEASP